MTKSVPATLTVRAAGDEPEILITTPSRDLMHDTIDPTGMDVSRYLKGPRAVNFAHDHSRLPVGKTVSLTKSPQGITARFRWLDANPEARIVRAVFEEGVLGASVEFVPAESPEPRSGGYHYAKTVLTGWALTGNPANPECLRLVKSLGLRGADADAVLLLDDDDEAEELEIEPHMVRDVMDEVLSGLITREVRRSAAGLLGVREEPVLLVADHAEDELVLDAEAVVAAFAGAMESVITREVRGAVNALRGRVD
jgi:hypothetical protein